MVSPEKLNVEGRDRLLAEANRVREMIVTFAHECLKLYLGIDRTRNIDVTEKGEEAEFYVLAEVLDLPDQEPHLALTVRLERSFKPEGDDPTTSLTIHHPIPENVNFTDDNFNPSELPKPERVYFVYEKDGVKSHFAVGEEIAYFYVPSDTTAPQIDEIDAMAEIEEGAQGGAVQSRLPFLAGLYEDLINMKGVVQRRFVIKADPSEVSDFS